MVLFKIVCIFSHRCYTMAFGVLDVGSQGAVHFIRGGNFRRLFCRNPLFAVIKSYFRSIEGIPQQTSIFIIKRLKVFDDNSQTPLTLIITYLHGFSQSRICSSLGLPVHKRIFKASAPLSFVRATGKFVFISEVKYQNIQFMYHLWS